jgi:hypothetical protein
MLTNIFTLEAISLMGKDRFKSMITSLDSSRYDASLLQDDELAELQMIVTKTRLGSDYILPQIRILLDEVRPLLSWNFDPDVIHHVLDLRLLIERVLAKGLLEEAKPSRQTCVDYFRICVDLGAVLIGIGEKEWLKSGTSK